MGESLINTIGSYTTTKIIELRGKLNEISEELEELESDLCGAELEHPGYFHVVIDHIDGDSVFLYTEDEEGNGKDVIITFVELYKLLNSTS